MKISYESDQLIKELENLIETVGFDKEIYCFFEKIEGESFLTDFFLKSEDLEKDEIETFETAATLSCKEALKILVAQNDII